MYVYMYVLYVLYVCMYVCMYVMYICMYCMYVCMYVCTLLCGYVYNMYLSVCVYDRKLVSFGTPKFNIDPLCRGTFKYL